MLTYNSIKNQFLKAVNVTYQKYKAPIFITGDSLGGVLCTYGALDLKEMIPGAEIIFINLESPRAGN